MDPKEIKRLMHLLHPRPRAAESASHDMPKLVGANGEEMPLPEPIYQLLLDILPGLLRGETLMVLPEDQPLTTQQAADLLGMSRPYLKRLLDQGAIPYYRVGTHRRLRFADVMAYRERRDTERRTQMEDLIALSEEMGVYA
jgi:excisionase family DNA binding protein